MHAPSVFKLPSGGAGNGGAAVHPSAQHDPAGPPDDERAHAQQNPAAPHAPAPAALRHSAAHAAHPTPPAARTPFVPVLLMAVALVAFFGAQLWDGTQQRQLLLAAHSAQQQTVDNAGKLRQSLDALAADTQRMADGGNANAALLVTELKKRGITISVPGAAGAPAVRNAPRP